MTYDGASMIESIEGVAHVERIGEGDPCLLIEVPHGADRRADYDALRSRLVGDLPADLHVFFHVNTDVGAWDYGRRVAERVVAMAPRRAALLVRSKIPRTFIDVNRLEDATEDLSKSGITAGVAPYVRDRRDLALLLDLHRRYVRVVEEAFDLVCANGKGFALTPHTYGPRTMGIEKIDDTIVDALRRAHEPEAWASWPVRPEIDLITRTADGVLMAPEGMSERVLEGYRALGYEAVENKTYHMHPSTQGFRWAARHPGQVFALEVRRDLLVREYAPFDEMDVVPEKADRVAGPLAAAIDAWLARS